MAHEEFRDDGTTVCPIHGLRYDPALTDGCIKCPHKTQPPGKRSAAPARAKSTAPPRSAPPPPSRPPASGPPPRRSITTPPLPFEPSLLGTGTALPPPGHGGPAITIIAAPRRRTSRRGLVMSLGVLFLGGMGGAAWFLRPESATDWASLVKPFRYGPNASKTGSIFVPSVAAERPCPLLLLLDEGRRSGRACARFARHCEKHGWIAIASDSFGDAPGGSDRDEAALLLEYARANASVDASRPVVAGYGMAAQCAQRLALTQPDVFSGAILESTSLAAWRDVGALARPDVTFFLCWRVGGQAREAMTTMKDEMDRKGLRVGFVEQPGSNAPMERDELDPAFAWFEAHRG